MRSDYAAVGRLLSHPTRSAMLDALMDGRALTAGELARVSGVPASSASEHLAILMQGNLVRVRASGRHRYYAIAGHEVAAALEALGEICPVERARSLRMSLEAERLGRARTCYDHLAGRLGVKVLDGLLERGWLEPDREGFAITGAGAAELGELGIDTAEVAARRRATAFPCLDWTERRFHLAGALGASLATLFLERDWVERADHGRGLHITDAGHRALRRVLGIELSAP